MGQKIGRLPLRAGVLDNRDIGVFCPKSGCALDAKAAASVCGPSSAPYGDQSVPRALFHAFCASRSYAPRHVRQKGALLRALAVLCCCMAMLCAFRIYGRARSRFDVHLPVRAVLQNPGLPNGCEATSLAALLNYKGVAANKLDLAYAYVPRAGFTETTDGRTGPDPEQAYAGDPATGLGFYCFAAPLAEGANRYLQAQGSALYAVDITGVTAEGLEQYLRGGDPVVVWITRDLSAPRTGSFTWTLTDTGEEYAPYVNLHCAVLIGWGRDTCELMDPLRGRRTVDKEAFLACFAQMGSRTMVIH